MAKELRVLIGRVIGGNIKQKIQSWDKVTKQPAVNKDGTPKMNFYFQLAVPKTSPELYDRDGMPGVFSLMISAAKGRQWPQDLNNDRYSWKCNDGDGLNANNKPYSEYAKDCYIFHFSSGLESLPKLLEVDPNGSPMESVNHDNFYTGVHVKAGVSFAHNSQVGNTEGIYCNPEFIVLVKHDTAINQSGMSLNEIADIVGHCEQVIGVPYPGVSQTAPAAMQQQTPVAPAAMQQQTPVAPAAMQQQTPVAPIPQFTMTSKANGLTREQYHEANWTDQQLIDAGMMNAPPHSAILN